MKELDEIRQHTSHELEKLRAQERQVHEIEANSLKDQRDQANDERDRARAAERDETEKYEDLTQRWQFKRIINRISAPKILFLKLP